MVFNNSFLSIVLWSTFVDMFFNIVRQGKRNLPILLAKDTLANSTEGISLLLISQQ